MPDEDPSFESELEPQQQPSAQLNPEPEQILNSAFGLISEQESDPEDEGSFDKFLREFKSHPFAGATCRLLSARKRPSSGLR
jgi:hypothetical protein